MSISFSNGGGSRLPFPRGKTSYRKDAPRLQQFHPSQEEFHPEDIHPEMLRYFTEYATLNQGPITANQVLGSGSYALCLDCGSESVSVDTTTAETEIYSHVIPGGMLGTMGSVRLCIYAAYLNGSGSSSTLEIKCSYGSTVMYEDTTAAFASLANLGVINMEFILCASGADAQGMVGNVFIGSRATTPTTGTGALDSAGSTFPIAGQAAENSKANNNITVSVQHSVNSAATIFLTVYTILQRIGR